MIATEVQVGSEEIGTDVSGRVLLGGKMEDRSPTYESANHVVNRLSETVPSPTRKLSSPLFNLIVGEYGDESKLAHVSISKQAMRENDKVKFNISQYDCLTYYPFNNNVSFFAGLHCSWTVELGEYLFHEFSPSSFFLVSKFLCVYLRCCYIYFF
mmetsp:Transcript_27141/g.33010  ORF Transcript_27141/g.33010 Transcript_27141/m.33010 type:complete len:155 (+) Transcript_27141:677-1141(+)